MPAAILAGSASRVLAHELARESGVQVVAGEAKRFPDGEGYVRILGDVAGRDVWAVQSTAPDEHLVELLLWLDAAREAGARSVTAIVPYMGYARQDRAFLAGEAVSARAAARAIAAACDRVVTVDPHKEESMAYFGGKGTSVSAVAQLADRLKEWGIDTILAPDKGAAPRAVAAAKRIGARVDHLEKTRLSATEVTMQAKALEVRGARVAILDDLIASGGTMRTAAQQLKAQGAREVVAACTHGLFTGQSAPRLLTGGIDRLLVTDTCPVPAGVEHVSAAKAIADALRVVA